MTFFLVIDLVLRIFPFFSHIFRMFAMLNVVYNTIFHSVHAFTNIRQHYFSKYWGGTNAWAVPPPQILGGPSIQSPPRSPPLVGSIHVRKNYDSRILYRTYKLCIIIYIYGIRTFPSDMSPRTFQPG